VADQLELDRRRRRLVVVVLLFPDGRLREEVDLDTLTAELLAVVDQTMQPDRTTLWLRPSHTATSPKAGEATHVRDRVSGG